MKILKGGGGGRQTHVLQLLKNPYGQNQAGRVWNHNLNDVLKSIGFKQSAADQCVWYQDKIILFYYVDDGIFMEPVSEAIDKVIEEIEKTDLDIEDKGDIDYDLGVNIEDQDNGKIRLTQPQIIDSIISDVNLPKNMAPR